MRNGPGINTGSDQEALGDAQTGVPAKSHRSKLNLVSQLGVNPPGEFTIELVRNLRLLPRRTREAIVRGIELWKSEYSVVANDMEEVVVVVDNAGRKTAIEEQIRSLTGHEARLATAHDVAQLRRGRSILPYNHEAGVDVFREIWEGRSSEESQLKDFRFLLGRLRGDENFAKAWMLAKVRANHFVDRYQSGARIRILKRIAAMVGVEDELGRFECAANLIALRDFPRFLKATRGTPNVRFEEIRDSFRDRSVYEPGDRSKETGEAFLGSVYESTRKRYARSREDPFVSISEAAFCAAEYLQQGAAGIASVLLCRLPERERAAIIDQAILAAQKKQANLASEDPENEDIFSTRNSDYVYGLRVETTRLCRALDICRQPESSLRIENIGRAKDSPVDCSVQYAAIGKASLIGSIAMDAGCDAGSLLALHLVNTLIEIQRIAVEEPARLHSKAVATRMVWKTLCGMVGALRFSQVLDDKLEKLLNPEKYRDAGKAMQGMIGLSPGAMQVVMRARLEELSRRLEIELQTSLGRKPKIFIAKDMVEAHQAVCPEENSAADISLCCRLKAIPSALPKVAEVQESLARALESGEVKGAWAERVTASLNLTLFKQELEKAGFRSFPLLKEIGTRLLSAVSGRRLEKGMCRAVMSSIDLERYPEFFGIEDSLEHGQVKGTLARSLIDSINYELLEDCLRSEGFESFLSERSVRRRMLDVINGHKLESSLANAIASSANGIELMKDLVGFTVVRGGNVDLDFQSLEKIAVEVLGEEWLSPEQEIRRTVSGEEELSRHSNFMFRYNVNGRQRGVPAEIRVHDWSYGGPYLSGLGPASGLRAHGEIKAKRDFPGQSFDYSIEVPTPTGNIQKDVSAYIDSIVLAGRVIVHVAYNKADPRRDRFISIDQNAEWSFVPVAVSARPSLIDVIGQKRLGISGDGAPKVVQLQLRKEDRRWEESEPHFRLPVDSSTIVYLDHRPGGNSGAHRKWSTPYASSDLRRLTRDASPTAKVWLMELIGEDRSAQGRALVKDRYGILTREFREKVLLPFAIITGVADGHGLQSLREQEGNEVYRDAVEDRLNPLYGIVTESLLDQLDNWRSKAFARIQAYPDPDNKRTFFVKSDQIGPGVLSAIYRGVQNVNEERNLLHHDVEPLWIAGLEIIGGFHRNERSKRGVRISFNSETPLNMPTILESLVVDRTNFIRTGEEVCYRMEGALEYGPASGQMMGSLLQALSDKKCNIRTGVVRASERSRRRWEDGMDFELIIEMAPLDYLKYPKSKAPYEDHIKAILRDSGMPSSVIKKITFGRY